MKKQFEEYKKLLAEMLAIKSVSTDVQYQPEIGLMVEWLKKQFKEAGFAVEVWQGKKTNPVVLAEYEVSPEAETVIIYGHYDVQPADLSEGWLSEPFGLAERRGRLFGRGVVDNKGQILVHILTAKRLIAEKKLGYNLKFLIEGNEETGNEELGKMISQNRRKLAGDILLVSDGELTNDRPTIEVSLRGGFNCKVVYRTGKNNLHSGLFGGAVPNAGAELTRMLAKLLAEDGKVMADGFYEGVDEISGSQLENNRRLTRQASNLAKLAGVKRLVGERGVDFFTQTGLRPTIQITGLKTGYTGEGFANIVPAEAEVRLNVRLAPAQKAVTIAESLKKWILAQTPEYVEKKLTFTGLHNPVKINTQGKYFEKAERGLKKVYGGEVNRKNVGGAIPFVGDVQRVLGIDTLLVPLANEDCSMHGANESFRIPLVMKALEFSWMFLGEEHLQTRYSQNSKKGRKKVRGKP